MARNGRRKKRRMTPQDEEVARRNFLDALEAQRSNSRNQKVKHAVKHEAAPPPLQGFYYDETKRRFFRNLPAFERQQREEIESRQQNYESTFKSAVNTRHMNSHTYVAYMARRQADYAWSARRQDSRKLMPRLRSGILSSHEVYAQDLNNDGRLTALALHPKMWNVGAVGVSSGKWQVLKLQEFEPKSSSKHVIPVCDFYNEGVITSLQWRPAQELDILACIIGDAQQSDKIVFIRIGNNALQGDAAMSSLRMKKTCFDNPWVAKWNPVDTSKISIGYGNHARHQAKSRAAYVDVDADNNYHQCAPTGLITSDVHAQSFFSTGNVVLNGTKCGGLWGWDLRTSSRMFEMNQEDALYQPASIVDIHVLNDCYQAIIQRSNGELRLFDLRTLRPVVEYTTGAAKRYVPDLRCAIDESESIVVAGGDIRRPLAINSFDLRQGHFLSSFQVCNNPRIQKRSTAVQQVQFKPSEIKQRDDNLLEIWAISHNELYVSSGERRDMNE
ncbi:putative WD40/YVTN repeat-like-containing domain superfamily [Plasmopara halstedii]